MPYELKTQIYRQLRAARPMSGGRVLERYGNIKRREMIETVACKGTGPGLQAYCFFI